MAAHLRQRRSVHNRETLARLVNPAELAGKTKARGHMPPVVRLAQELTALLGEGPVWSEDDGLLYWVDSLGRRIHLFDPRRARQRWVAVPEKIGSLALRRQGGLIVGLQSGVYFFDLASQGIESVMMSPGYGSDQRFNDGKCDPAGRFVIGSMDERPKMRTAHLFRINLDLTATVLRSGMILSNGIGWSPDGSLMYYTDSGDQRIYVCDYSCGEIRGERVFATDEDCLPDGLAVDCEGYVWSAKWDGGRVARYAPDGTVDLVLPLPVPRVTCVTFGGPDLRTLYITTARVGLSEAQLRAFPLSGSLFAASAPVPGMPATPFLG